MESYLGIITGSTVAVPLDVNLPGEDLIDLLNRSDAAGLFLSPKQKGLLEQIREKCPKLQKIWMLEDAAASQTDSAEISSLADVKAVGADSAADADRPDPEESRRLFSPPERPERKGVMLTQKNLAENVKAVQYTAKPGSVLLSVLPIHHAFCLVMDWLKGFSLGTTVCINDSLLHMVKKIWVYSSRRSC